MGLAVYVVAMGSDADALLQKKQHAKQIAGKITTSQSAAYHRAVSRRSGFEDVPRWASRSFQRQANPNDAAQTSRFREEQPLDLPELGFDSFE
jgi:hypothetical protein